MLKGLSLGTSGFGLECPGLGLDGRGLSFGLKLLAFDYVTANIFAILLTTDRGPWLTSFNVTTKVAQLR